MNALLVERMSHSPAGALCTSVLATLGYNALGFCFRPLPNKVEQLIFPDEIFFFFYF